MKFDKCSCGSSNIEIRKGNGVMSRVFTVLVCRKCKHTVVLEGRLTDHNAVKSWNKHRNTHSKLDT